MAKGKKEILMFGYGLCGALTIFGARFWWKEGLGPASFKFFAAAAVLATITTLRPQWLAPAHKVMGRVLGVVGHVLSLTALTAIFYLVLTPMALGLRLFGKALLDTRMSDSQSSTWLEHKSVENVSEYENQF